MICVCCRENNPIFYLMMTLVERRNVVVFTFFFNMRNILAQYFLCKCLSRSLLIRKKIFENLNNQPVRPVPSHFFSLFRWLFGRTHHVREYPDSGMQEIFAVGIQILDLEIWNTTQGIRSPTYNWNAESKFHWQRIRNQEPGIPNQWRGLQTPRLSCISLHKTRKPYSVENTNIDKNTVTKTS